MKAWKAEEQRVAALFGQRRRPLSGNRKAGIGLSDTMNLDGSEPEVFIEVKSWSRMPLIRHIRKAELDSSGRPVILAIHAKNSKKRYAVVDLHWLASLYNNRLRPVPIGIGDVKSLKLDGPCVNCQCDHSGPHSEIGSCKCGCDTYERR